ncbi:MAG TPA: Uma2 family endonuclease [Chthoniobacterales bacterium]|nr:Uma2 family endonuclease [Chthoniobacterales bacterium]
MPVNTNFPPLTIENYKLLPETGPRYQLIQGDLYMAPAPNRFHQEISRNLQFELHSYLKCNPIGKLFDAPFDVYLDAINVFQPDIIIVLNERLGILTEQGAEGAPELVIEILSPKTRRLDLLNKKQEYARAGVKELWIIDPESRAITIHQFASDGVEKIRDVDEEDTLSTDLLPGFDLAVETIFER